EEPPERDVRAGRRGDPLLMQPRGVAGVGRESGQQVGARRHRRKHTQARRRRLRVPASRLGGCGNAPPYRILEGMDLEARLAGLLPSRRWRALVSRAWRLSAPLREIAAGVLGEPVAAAPAPVREVHLPIVTAARPAPPARPRFDPIEHPPSWMPLAMS